MTCSNKQTTRRRRAILRRAISLPALPGRAFWLGCGLVGALMPAATFAAPGPIQKDFADADILTTLPDSSTGSATAPANATELADQLQAFISQARGTGDPRFLGYAERLLEDWPEAQLTDRLRVLRATLSQSLHRFEAARADLEQVLADTNQRQQRIQARLTLANLELVQGHYQAARRQCDALTRDYPGLIAESCLAQMQARTGEGAEAYARLQNRLAAAPGADPTSRAWAQGTLGDIAAQLGREAATEHWQAVLRDAPTDLYTRALLADWHLERGNYRATLDLTASYEQVDGLGVLRAIALQQVAPEQARHLTQALRARFEEAQWRGALLHQRDFARFLLDIEQRPEPALEHAWANWREQREPLDTRLVLRAAMAAQDQDVAQEVRQWLRQQGQSDSRYPETPQ